VLALALGVPAALLAACGGGSAGPTSTTSAAPTLSSPSASPSTSPTATVAPAGEAPLTDLPVSSAALLHRPVVAVSVRLRPGAAVTGLRGADLVYEEFDQPGMSRLLAIYQSTDATVGPVAATAPVDPKLLVLLGRPGYAFAGGPEGFVVQVKPSVVTGRSTATYPSLYQAGAGGVTVSTAALRSSATGGALAAPPGTIPFASGGAPAPTNGKPVTRVTITVAGHAPEVWAWNGSAWAGPGGALVTNVVVQQVAYRTLTPHKAAAVGSAQPYRRGPATVVAGPHALAVTWERAQPLQITNYLVQNHPIGLLPGWTWVVLAPTGSQVALS
jgi:hypothetical protein